MELNSQLIVSESVNKDKIIHSLIQQVEELKKTVTEIKNDKILENLQLPEEVLEQSGVIKPPQNRLKRGRGWRPLMESEILEAQSKCINASECARYLGVNYRTYKKYAVALGLFKINPWGRGSKKRYWAPDKGKYPLNQILEGKFPNYPVYRLKDLLIRSGTKKAECENCGFNEHRITDNKMPLLISFKDGNEKNHKLENLEILCYNCMFLVGRGYIRSGKVNFYFRDPDRIQGSARNIEARF